MIGIALPGGLCAFRASAAGDGGKPWTLAEHAVIRERVNRSRVSDSDKDQLGVLPIRVGDGEVVGISFNTIIPDVRPTKRSLNKAVELILNRRGLVTPECQVAVASPVHPVWPNETTPFEHGLANHAEQWPVIQKLMTADAAKRILIFKGRSNYGKTTLLNAAVRYAKILRVPTAYVNFKDAQFLRQTNVLQRLRLDLGAVLPGFTAAKEPDPWTLLQALRALSSPALIVLDTDEKITETKELAEWIETQLLAEVEENKQLRFLIGGQKVPECTHARWQDLADVIELNEINDKQAYFVSYAWGDRTPEGQQRELIVDQLCAAAEERGINILRDKKVLGLGDRISKFMQRIGRGNRSLRGARQQISEITLFSAAPRGR